MSQGRRPALNNTSPNKPDTLRDEADPGAAEHARQVDITVLDGYLELTPPTPGTVRPFVVEVDPDYAPTSTNLGTPLLVIRILAKDCEDLGCMVIDRWHRVYRARVEEAATCRRMC